MATTQMRGVRMGDDWDVAAALAQAQGNTLPDLIRGWIRAYINGQLAAPIDQRALDELRAAQDNINTALARLT